MRGFGADLGALSSPSSQAPTRPRATANAATCGGRKLENFLFQRKFRNGKSGDDRADDVDLLVALITV
ncbi:hypothetical protein V6Z11_A13G208600 [Gossypium hirsutum]